MQLADRPALAAVMGKGGDRNFGRKKERMERFLISDSQFCGGGNFLGDTFCGCDKKIVFQCGEWGIHRFEKLRNDL